MVDLTLVTGIVDIGRAALPSRLRGRSTGIPRRLPGSCSICDVPMVVYADAALGLATRQRDDTTRGRSERGELERFPHFDKVQRIRALPSHWRRSRRMAGRRACRERCCRITTRWSCRSSYWLAEQARANPFGTRHFVWIDARHRRARYAVDVLRRSGCAASACLCEPSRQFICSSALTRTPAASEIHGFERTALARYANVAHVDSGGAWGVLRRARRLRQSRRRASTTVVLRHTLEHGYMGTEESVLTILALLHPGMFDRFTLRDDGLLATFFEDLWAGEDRRGHALGRCAARCRSAQSRPAHGRAPWSVCFGRVEGIVQRTRGYTTRYGWREVVLEPVASVHRPTRNSRGWGWTADRRAARRDCVVADWPILRPDRSPTAFAPGVVRVRRTKLPAGRSLRYRALFRAPRIRGRVVLRQKSQGAACRASAEDPRRFALRCGRPARRSRSSWVWQCM